MIYMEFKANKQNLYYMVSLQTVRFVCFLFLNPNISTQHRGCAAVEMHNQKSIWLCTADVQNSLKEIVGETIKIS